MSAHVAIEPQSAIDVSQGLARGQQSDMSSPADMSPEADIEVISGDFTGDAALPGTGSIATEIAIRSASIVRPMLMGALGGMNIRFLESGDQAVDPGPEQRLVTQFSERGTNSRLFKPLPSRTRNHEDAERYGKKAPDCIERTAVPSGCSSPP